MVSEEFILTITIDINQQHYRILSMVCLYIQYRAQVLLSVTSILLKSHIHPTGLLYH